MIEGKTGYVRTDASNLENFSRNSYMGAGPEKGIPLG